MYHKAMNWRNWLHGLGSAFIGGGANVIATMVIDPEDFNVQNGIPKIMSLWVASGITSAILYLKQSPLPVLEKGEKVSGETS